MLLVPRSTLRSTSPVRRPRCQRRDKPWRWAKSCTCTCRLVNCCTHTHRKVRRLLTKPVEPAGVPTGQSVRMGCPPPPQPRGVSIPGGGTCPTLSVPSTPSFLPVLTSAAALQELQPHVDADGPGQGVPGGTLRQLVHWGHGGHVSG